MTRAPLRDLWLAWPAIQLADLLTATLGRRAARRRLDQIRGNA